MSGDLQQCCQTVVCMLNEAILKFLDKILLRRYLINEKLLYLDFKLMKLPII